MARNYDNRDIIENTCIENIERYLRLIQSELTIENNIILIKHLIDTFSTSFYIRDKSYLEVKTYSILELIDEYMKINPSYELIDCKDKLLIYYNRWFNNISDRKNIISKLRDEIKHNLDTYFEQLQKRFRYIDCKYFREYYTNMVFNNEETRIFIYYIFWRLNQDIQNQKDIKFIVKMVNNALSKTQIREEVIHLYRKTITLEKSEFSKQLNGVICLNVDTFKTENCV